MPWWVIGLSAFGTAIDSGDYVGIVGGSYKIGLSQLAQWWLSKCSRAYTARPVLSVCWWG